MDLVVGRGMYSCITDSPLPVESHSLLSMEKVSFRGDENCLLFQPYEENGEFRC